MSRRREATELARALLLSTQEASTAAHLSPHTLSSSKSNTPDSKEMELHVVNRSAPSPLSSVPSSAIPASIAPPSSSNWGFPPVVQTNAQDQLRSTNSPRALPALQQISDPISTGTTSSHSNNSHITAFTPSKVTNAAIPLVPSSSDLHATPTIALSTPLTTSSSGKAPFSSPNMPIPSSRLSNDHSNHISSGSSHRPLFSPTQTSSRQPVSSSSAPKPKPVVTYGKARNPLADEVLVMAEPATRRQLSPLKAADPPLMPPAPRSEPLPMSDDEDEAEEAIEPIESRPAAAKTPKPQVEVVLPARPRSVGKNAPPESVRPDSPDPLDTNIRRQLSFSPETFPLDRLPPPITPIASSSSKSSKSSKSRAVDTQQSDEAAGPIRISKRQQVQKEKEELEKEARREARRIRKEKERLEQEKEETESKRDRRRSSTRGTTEEQSIIPIPRPPSSRKTPARSVTKSPIKPVSEVIDVEDESLQDIPAEMRIWNEPAPSPISVEAAPADHAAGKKSTSKRKKQEDDDELEAEWDHDEEDDYEPVKKKAAKANVKEKKKPKETAKNTKSKVKDRGAVKETEVSIEEEVLLVVDESVEAGSAAKAEDTPAAKAQGTPEEPKAQEEPVAEEEAQEDSSLSLGKSPATASTTTTTSARSPLKPISNGITTPRGVTPYRNSPGPSTGPKGYTWKTERSDLASVLTKFGGARQSGMSKRSKIVSLHTKIGPPVKALPPPPPKASKKKKEESDEEDSDEAEMESDGEGGLRKKKKERGLEWYMVED